jgi:hypothetical protein
MVGLQEKEHWTDIQDIDFRIFIRDWKVKPGQHVTCIGPNGSGKTTLMMWLLAKQKRAVMLGTKKKDPFYDELMKRGWVRIRRWPKSIEDDSKGRQRLLLWIPTIIPTAVPATAKVFKDALDKIAQDDVPRDVYIDELMFAASPKWLDLSAHFELGWQQWRSSGNSLWVSAQRSSNIPLLAYDQVEWIFVARENDLGNADRIGEMAGLDRFQVRDVVRTLERYQWLGINVREGELVRFTPEKIV